MAQNESVSVVTERKALDRLKGKVALVTGTARPRGVGNSVAKLFAREGASVALTDIDDHLWNCVKTLEDAGFDAVGFKTDLTKLNEVKEMAQKIVGRFGKIDILCNVAGKSVPPRPPFLEMSTEYWDMVMDRNLKTTVNCCRVVLPYMVKQMYGKVINIGSITGPITAYRYCAAYAASKGAVLALSKALALEMGEFNITVNTILPGDIDTADKPWTRKDGPRDLSIFSKNLAPPISRPAMSEEIADLALFLATDESRFITGTEILIEGGLTIVEPIVAGPT